MRIYLASSWRNTFHSTVLNALREEGHQVYDFRHPEPGDCGFKWDLVAPHWGQGDIPSREFRETIETSEVATYGFNSDLTAINECEALVLLLPCGNSAHMEAGYAKGQGKRLFILCDHHVRPDLMYSMADGICVDLDEMVQALGAVWPVPGRFSTYAYNVPPEAQVCRVCGCWDGHACPGGCSWVEKDLCSNCTGGPK